MHAHQRASRRRFDAGDEKRHLGVGVGLGPSKRSGSGAPTAWASRVVSDELPPQFFPRPQSAPGGRGSGGGLGGAGGGARGSFVSHDSDSEAALPFSRQAKSQEDWVRWATKSSRPSEGDFDVLLDQGSSNAATADRGQDEDEDEDEDEEGEFGEGGGGDGEDSDDDVGSYDDSDDSEGAALRQRVYHDMALSRPSGSLWGDGR